MNSLSWLLYLASILPQLQISLGIAAGVLFFWFLVVCIDRDSRSYREAWKVPKWQMPVAAILLLIAALIPSKNTLYLIAGSEAGEAVVTSQQGQEILNDVQEVIRAQLGKLKQ